MSDQEQALRRELKAALQANEPAATPSFKGLWAAAQELRERPAAASSGWAESFAAGAAVASVVAIGLLITANVRKTSDDPLPDTALYARLINQTTWTSPTDVLLDSAARYPLAGLPELPAVNTNPSLEFLL
jgi:hypothetical protein